MTAATGAPYADPFAADAERLTPDTTALAAFWDHFAEADGTYEVRCPKSRRGGPHRWYGTVAGYFTDRAAFVQQVGRITGADVAGVFVTLNPTKPELRARANNRLVAGAKATTTDDQITGRRRLLLDFDPKRPADIPATDAEVAAALSARD